jgi:hypothetical protein
MTIAAGFRTIDGVLIWADTEYSGTGSKSYAPKIIPAIVESVPQCSAIFSFAADNSHLAIAAIQKCVKAMGKNSTSLKHHGDIADLVESVLSEQYKKHVSAAPKPEDRSIYQIIFAARGHEGPTGLYSSWQYSVREHDDYECIGIGEYLGRALISPLFTHGMNLQEATVLACYVAGRAKEHVQNVSGQTNLVYLPDEGMVKATSWRQTRELEEGIGTFDKRVRALLFQMFQGGDQDFLGTLATFNEDVKDLRMRLGLSDRSVNKMNLWPSWQLPE